MSREQKLALILGFLAVLVVAMLISDHYSKANKDRLAGDVAESPQMIDPTIPSPYSGAMASNNPGSSGSYAPLPPTHLDAQANTAGGGFLDDALRASGQSPVPGEFDPTRFDQGNATPEPIVLTQGGVNNDPSLDRDSTLLHQLRRQGESLVDGLNGLPAAASRTSIPTGTTPTEPNQDDLNRAELQRQLDESAARARQTPPAPAAERWHIVVANDSLFALSKKYYGDGKHWKKLAEANKGRMGDNNTLRTGVRLLIPDAAAIGLAGATPPAVLTKPIAAKPETKPETKPQTKAETKPATPTTTAGRVYEVKKGDTLGEISMRELGTSKRAGEIITLNNLKDANSIRVGQKLKMPAK